MLQVKLAFSLTSRIVLYELEENKKCQVSLVVKYIVIPYYNNHFP